MSGWEKYFSEGRVPRAGMRVCLSVAYGFASAALAYIVGRPQREMNGWVICRDEAKALVSRDLSGAADNAVPAVGWLLHRYSGLTWVLCVSAYDVTGIYMAITDGLF